MKELTNEMRHKVRPILYAIVFLGIGLLVFGLVVAISEIRQFTEISSQNTEAIRAAQKVNTKKIDASRATLEIVKDCTQPKGKCFQEGQKRTGEAVGTINQITVLSASLAVTCSQEPGSKNPRVVQMCIEAGLAKAGYPVGSSPREPAPQKPHN